MVLTLEEAVPASALIYLHEFEPTTKNAIYLASALSRSIVDDELYGREVCKVISSIHVKVEQARQKKNGTIFFPLPWISRCGFKVPSEVFDQHECLLPLYLSVDKDHSANAQAAAQLLYTLKLRALNHVCARQFIVPKSALAFDIGCSLLTNFAESSTFAVTGDSFLHLIVKIHLSAVNTIFCHGAPPYRLLSTTLADNSNDLLRPYIDEPISVQLTAACATADANPDNVVLYIILCTLAVEMEKKVSLKMLYNSEVLNRAQTDVAVPFLFVDFPVRSLRGCRDAYGFMVDDTLHVGNGVGVIATFLGWLHAARAELPNAYEVFSQRTLSSGNVLSKFAL